MRKNEDLEARVQKLESLLHETLDVLTDEHDFLSEVAVSRLYGIYEQVAPATLCEAETDHAQE